MEDLIIKQTRATPCIEFRSNGELSIEGSSDPADALEFYAPLLNWVEAHLLQSQEKVSVQLRLQYVSDSSLKMLQALLSTLEEAKGMGRFVEISCRIDHYDESAQRIIEGLSVLADIRFTNTQNQNISY